MTYGSQYYGVSSLGDSLYHHGIKGQKWGIRRYQNLDGSLTPAGLARRGYSTNKTPLQSAASKLVSSYYTHTKIRSLLGDKRTRKDSYIDTSVKLNRIQSFDTFEQFAFYATTNKRDNDAYEGLFGHNLISRAKAAGKQQIKEAEKTGDYETVNNIKSNLKNMRTYQLQIDIKKRLKIPSEDNAGNITGSLLKDKEFHKDLSDSISSAKQKMRRPSQQMLFAEAQRLLQKDPKSLGRSDKTVIYKALNLTLTNHDPVDIRVQNKFYEAMKRHGYGALSDINDKTYSSYHAKDPVIVFDLGSVRLGQVRQLDSKRTEALYKKYNTRRLIRDLPEQTIGNTAKKLGLLGSRMTSSVEQYAVMPNKKRQ